MLTSAKFTLRHPQEVDRELFDAMWRRCSPATRLGRLHSPCPNIPMSYLDAVLSDPDGTLVGVFGEKMVAMASLIPSGAFRAELAALVEDAWQGRGIGSALVRTLLAAAPRRQISVVTASILADRPWVAQALRRVPGRYRVLTQGPTLEVTVDLVTYPKESNRC